MCKKLTGRIPLPRAEHDRTHSQGSSQSPAAMPGRTGPHTVQFTYNKVSVDKSSVTGPGYLSRIRIFPSRNPAQKDSESRTRIRIKELRYLFNPKKLFLSSRKYDRGCSSQIRIPDPDFDILPIPDPGFKRAPDPGSGSAILVKRNKHCHKLWRVFLSAHDLLGN